METRNMMLMIKIWTTTPITSFMPLIVPIIFIIAARYRGTARPVTREEQIIAIGVAILMMVIGFVTFFFLRR